MALLSSSSTTSDVSHNERPELPQSARLEVRLSAAADAARDGLNGATADAVQVLAAWAAGGVYAD